MSIHSNDRASGKTKLERLGKRAMCDKDTVFNNLGHLIDETLLIASYQELDRSKAVGIDGETKGDVIWFIFFPGLVKISNNSLI